MELSWSSASLMASSCLPTKPPYAHYAYSNSVFLTNGGICLSKAPLGLVSGRRRRTPATAVPSRRLGCRCMFGLGVPELVVIAGVAALVFGPKKLPEVGRSIGKTVKSFQQAAKEFETELKKEPEGLTNPAPPTDSPKAVSSENDKEFEASGTKEST